MTTYALIHGAYHGGWCWNLVSPLLEAAGHRAISVDLPVSDISAGLEDYADIVCDAVAGDEDVVVVGHSMGGLVAPVVASRRPVEEIVFVCAPVPEPGLSMNDLRERDSDMMLGALQGHLVDVGDGTRACDEVGARKAFLHACPELLADWAVRLLRPQSGTPTAQPVPIDRLPSCRFRYVVCADDRMISPDWSRRRARAVLGAEPVELTGGHDPMLSSPMVLSEVLLEASTTTRPGGAT